MMRQLLPLGVLAILCHVSLAVGHPKKNTIASYGSPLNDALTVLALDMRGGGGREEEWEEYDLEEKGEEQEEEISIVETIDQEESVAEEEESGDDEGDLDDDDHVDQETSTREDTNDSTIDMDERSDNAEGIDENVEEVISDVLFMQSDIVEDVGEEESWEPVDEPEDDENDEQEEPPFAVNAQGESFFNTDDDSSAFIDREELADAYDEAESILGSMRAGGSGDEDRVSIDDVPPPGDDEIDTANDEQEPVQPEAREVQVEVIADQSPSEPDPEPDPDPDPDPESTPGQTDGQVEDQSPLEQELVTQDSLVQGEGDTCIHTFIDETTEEILIQECKYTRAEVNAMKPEIAAVVAQKRLRRPLEGMPPNWIKEGHSSNQSRNLIRIVKNIPKAIIPISLGVLAIYGGREVRNIATTVSTKNAFAFVSPKKIVPEPEPEKPLQEDTEEEELPTKFEHLDEVIPRSIKPGEQPIAPVDETMLDKAITWVERRIKAFLRMEI